MVHFVHEKLEDGMIAVAFIFFFSRVVDDVEEEEEEEEEKVTFFFLFLLRCAASTTTKSSKEEGEELQCGQSHLSGTSFNCNNPTHKSWYQLF